MILVKAETRMPQPHKLLHFVLEKLKKGRGV